MDVINCTDNFSERLVLDTIRFWSENSYQHIEVLLNSATPQGPYLYKDFEKDLKLLFKKFKGYYKDTDTTNSLTELIFLMNNFLHTNDYFIKVLEKMKFEGFNGFPDAYQTVYHFLYEQRYIKELFRPIEYTPGIDPASVVIHAHFKKLGLGITPLECIYNQMYFWCIIGAEHPSIIGGVSPAEEMLPKTTKNLLLKVTKEFNNIAHQLSSVYANLSEDNLRIILREFTTVNKEFLKLLEKFDEKNSQYLPDSIKKQLPKLFFGVLEHIEDEHKYALHLAKRFEKYLNK